MKENLMSYLVLNFHKNGLNNQPVGVIQSKVRFFFGHGYIYIYVGISVFLISSVEFPILPMFLL